MTRRPDVMELLARARPASLDPEDDARRRTRDREAALAQVPDRPDTPATTPATQPARRARQARRVARRTALGVGLTAAAAAVAVVVTTTQGLWPAPPPGATPSGTAPTTTMSARQVLLAAATRAEETLATTGRYWHVRKISESPVEVGRSGDTYTLTQRTVWETWKARTAPGPAWEGDRELGARPATPADEAAWRAAGSPRRWDLGPTDTVGEKHDILRLDPGPGELWKMRPSNYPPAPANTYLMRDATDPAKERHYSAAELEELPTDPAGLLNVTGEGFGQPEGRLIDLLTEYPAPPQVRAAAFRALAGLPNVRTLGPATDSMGRAGTAIELTEEYSAEGRRAAFAPDGREIASVVRRMVVDPQSSRILETSTSIEPVRGPVKQSGTTFVEAGWTNERPHVPELP